MSTETAFLDTNVLVYLAGGPDPMKQLAAQEVFERYSRHGNAVLSTQVVQEFYYATRNLGMPRHERIALVNEFLDLPLIINGPAEIQGACLLEERYQISFWDALIVAAAESAGAAVLLSEDLNDGQQYGSVTVRNPFLADGA